MKYIVFVIGCVFMLVSCGPAAGVRAQNADGSITLFSNGNAEDAVVIDASGNLGLGQQNPKDKLEVNGQIHARSVKVDLDRWADDVFSKEYILDPLHQIAAYIATHGHLPDIPSEQEVLEHGIDLGAMNRALLKKIEELTLHLIHKEDQLQQLQQQVDALALRLSVLEKSSE